MWRSQPELRLFSRSSTSLVSASNVVFGRFPARKPLVNQSPSFQVIFPRQTQFLWEKLGSLRRFTLQFFVLSLPLFYTNSSFACQRKQAISKWHGSNPARWRHTVCGKEDLLKFKSSITMGKKEEVTMWHGYWCQMGWIKYFTNCWPTRIFTQAQPSLGFTENHPKKEHSKWAAVVWRKMSFWHQGPE